MKELNTEKRPLAKEELNFIRPSEKNLQLGSFKPVRISLRPQRSFVKSKSLRPNSFSEKTEEK